MRGVPPDAQEKPENGWFRVSPGWAKDIRAKCLAAIALLAWIIAFVVGGVVTAFWFGPLASSGPGQDLTLMFVFMGVILGAPVLIVAAAAGSPQNGEIGFVQTLVAFVLLFFVLTAVFSEVFRDGFHAFFWAVHTGTNYGVIASVVYWGTLMAFHPELVPERRPGDALRRLLLAAGVFLVGQIASNLALRAL